ncbi:MAG: acetamidase/formamidase family protein [Pseudomonadota bacterium]|nr:acetamidase/formamidase family protein [Pseudomonadota bacterium]
MSANSVLTGARHTLHRHQGHYGWSPDQAPVVAIAPGDSVTLAIRDASDGVITPHATAHDLVRLDPDRANPLTGPVAVEGARPGDILLVEMLDFHYSGWGWTGILPGFGLLAEEFPDPFLVLSRHDERFVDFTSGIRLPVRPFTGTVGVAPPVSGRLSAIPPHQGGGNLDMRQIGRGSTLALPVHVEHALLSVGDTHVAQGDGEVCGTAVESPMSVELRVDLVRGGEPLTAPHVRYHASAVCAGTGEVQATLGIGGDLMVAAADAVRRMIDLLQKERGLSAELAYCLCSVAGDLRISEVVNQPSWVVSLHLPLAVFD